MASPTVSYMRSLSFATAAPHHSHSAWAAVSTSANAARSQQLYLSNHHSINSHNTNIYTHHLHNFNSHHDRSYNQHLHQFHHQGSVGYSSESTASMMATTTTLARTRPASFASPAPSGGRRRSSSIRSRNPPPFIKFDPFADEPTSPEKSLTSALVVQPKPISASNEATTLYTIEIPAAGSTELQRYAFRSPRSSARRFSFAANDNPVGNTLGDGISHSPSENRAATPPALSRPPPRPHGPSPSLRSSPPPPPVRQPLLSGSGALGGPNVSKLVAGILLNRMSAGKPMRRRVPSFGEKKAYIKSCLSSVVSVEA